MRAIFANAADFSVVFVRGAPAGSILTDRVGRTFTEFGPHDGATRGFYAFKEAPLVRGEVVTVTHFATKASWTFTLDAELTL